MENMGWIQEDIRNKYCRGKKISLVLVMLNLLAAGVHLVYESGAQARSGQQYIFRYHLIGGIGNYWNEMNVQDVKRAKDKNTKESLYSRNGQRKASLQKS